MSTETVKESLSYLDKYTDSLRRGSAANGRPVVCGKGCFHCCKEMVWAERREVVFLVEHIAPETLPEVTERARVWWEGFFEGGFQHMPASNLIHGPGTLMNYRGAELWCPLLKEGICTAYTERPGACRIHLATLRRELCADDYQRRKQEFASSDITDRVLLKALNILTSDEALPCMQFDHLGIWLGHLLLGKTERSASAQDISTR